MFHKSSKSELLIKYAVMISDLYEVIGRLDKSADYLVRIGNEIHGAPIIVALFFEQAGLRYLKMKQYRKFALYVIDHSTGERSGKKFGMKLDTAQ